METTMPEAIYCYDVACVRFAVHLDNGRRVVAQIEEDALRDHFGARGGGDDLLETYYDNAGQIEALALQKLHHKPRGPVVLTTRDFIPVDLPVIRAAAQA